MSSVHGHSRQERRSGDFPGNRATRKEIRKILSLRPRRACVFIGTFMRKRFAMIGLATIDVYRFLSIDSRAGICFADAAIL